MNFSEKQDYFSYVAIHFGMPPLHRALQSLPATPRPKEKAPGPGLILKQENFSSHTANTVSSE